MNDLRVELSSQNAEYIYVSADWTTYLESFTPAKNEVAQRHSHIIINNFAVSLRSIVIAKYLHRTNDLDPRGVGRYNNNTLLTVTIRVVGIALAEDEMQGTSWVTSSTDPPFVTVDDNFIALLSNGGADVGGVR